MLSDSNAQFVSFCKPTQSRDAVLANPLRNISGDLFQLARNFGVDLIGASLEVRKHADEELSRLDRTGISSISFNPSFQTTHRSMQTDTMACEKCEKRESLQSHAKSTQATMVGQSVSTQYVKEPGSFTVDFCAQYMESISAEQCRVLSDFCRLFAIEDERFATDLPPPKREAELTRFVDRDRDSLLAFANPENPDAFITLSPLREVSRSPPSRNFSSQSPKRRRIAERLGQKIDSPGFPYQGNDYRPHPSSNHLDSPVRYSRSPIFSRDSPPRRRRNSRDSPPPRYSSPPSRYPRDYPRMNSPPRNLRSPSPVRYSRNKSPLRRNASPSRYPDEDRIYSNSYRIPSPRPRERVFRAGSPRRESPLRTRRRTRSTSYERSLIQDPTPMSRRGRF